MSYILDVRLIQVRWHGTDVAGHPVLLIRLLCACEANSADDGLMLRLLSSQVRQPVAPCSRVSPDPNSCFKWCAISMLKYWHPCRTLKQLLLGIERCVRTKGLLPANLH